MKQFDRRAAAYDAARKKINYPEALYTMVASLSAHHDAALDLGCGNGVSTVRLRPYYAHVEGVDLGANLIDRARANDPELTFSVARAEDFVPTRRFDLITCATAFYWMDRKHVLERVVAGAFESGGVFCAYKYDFPVVYGPLRDFVEHELALKWAKYRDPRLTGYDDTLEILQETTLFDSAERRILPNILDLTPKEVALFFASTSYVTRYMDDRAGPAYADELIAACERLDPGPTVKVNFDVHAFVARRG
jgi:SAM-dependent methyltransferase